MSKPYVLRTDGGARGNPGPAGIGIVLESPDGEVLAEIGKGIGWTTNNVAEYAALIEGLEIARMRDLINLVVFLDSLLVVQQMKGAFKVKHAGLKPLHQRARQLAEGFESIRFVAVPREQNKRADSLVNEGIDLWIEENPGFLPPDSGGQMEIF